MRSEKHRSERAEEKEETERDELDLRFYFDLFFQNFYSQSDVVLIGVVPH